MAKHNPGSGFLNVLPDWVALNSAADYLKRNGTNESNILTITGKTQGASDPIFIITGAVEVLRLWGVFIDVTDVSSLTDCYLDLWDESNQVLLTDNVAPTDLSGVGLYALVGRWFFADEPLALMDSDEIDIVDGAGIGLDLFATFMVQTKYGVENVMRFNYASDGGGCEAQIKWTCIWRSLVDGYGEVTPYV